MIKYNYRWIGEMRQAAGYTQEAAARLSGIKQQQWSRYESGKTTPSLEVLTTIMHVLLVDAQDLTRIFEIRTNDVKGRTNVEIEDLPNA